MHTKRNLETSHEAEILVVEDSATQAEQLKYLLEQHRFRVTVATNGSQALSAMRLSRPQLVISDIVMPEMDGYALCRAIKSERELESLPVILVTSLTDVQDVLKGLECGADNFIRKPYDEKYLLARVDYLLMNRAMRKDQKVQMGMEIYLAGQKHFITAERQQILDLLISTYEEAVRIKQELEVRQQELANAALYERTHGDVLRLFNATFDRTQILQGMLAILAASHPFPAAAVYAYDEWSGTYRLAASHPAPAGLRGEFDLGAGALGAAMSEDRTMVLAGHDADLFPALGTGTHAPAVVISPVSHQGKRLAVLLLAAEGEVNDSDLAFIARLADQLGVALHNVQQYSDLQLLAEQLRLRSEEISSKNRLLEEASRMKSEFLANMSHELRTPLNAIIGFSEVLRDGIAGPLSNRQREYMTDIFDSGQHLLAIINDVLDLSKIEAGRMVLEGDTTDIAALLRNSLSVIKEKAMAHRISLVLDAPDELGELWLDPRKVKQIIYNLLSNAVKFTPEEGAVTLHARIVGREDAQQPRDQRPELRTPLPATAEEFLQISVADTGIGISAADMTSLFQPFVQIDSSLSRRYEGTGLGLAMVRKLAELHDGAVAVASLPGQGSTFTVWLPCRTSSAADDAAAATTPEQPLANCKTPLVLVIEDDDKAADLIRLLLEDDGCRTLRAATAEEALALLACGCQPDLITLDLLLPQMDGWDFLARLRADRQSAHIPVAIISIVADNCKGVALGASEVLQKPISAGDLAATLARLGYPGKPATVLVVDDDPKAVEIMASRLESAGNTVLRAYGGAEGLQMALVHVPDLLVLDLMMPEVSGFEVVAQLRANPKTARIPVLVVTAKLLTAEDHKLLNGYVLEVMQKSKFDHAHFIGEVRRALGRKWDKSVEQTAEAHHGENPGR